MLMSTYSLATHKAGGYIHLEDSECRRLHVCIIETLNAGMYIQLRDSCFKLRHILATQQHNF